MQQKTENRKQRNSVPLVLQAALLRGKACPRGQQRKKSAFKNTRFTAWWREAECYRPGKWI
jgi:hypothetical protein